MSDFHRKPMPIDEMEEWIGCQKGALTHIFPTPEAKEFYKDMKHVHSFMKLLNNVSVAGSVVAIPFTAGGLLLRLTPSGRAFDYMDGSHLSGQLLVPTIGFILLSYGTKPVQKMLQREKADKIAAFRARLPEHTLK